LIHYIPPENIATLPAIYNKSADEKTFGSEREILYQILFDLKKDMNDLKKFVHDVIDEGQAPKIHEGNAQLFRKLYPDNEEEYKSSQSDFNAPLLIKSQGKNNIEDTEEFVEESLSLEDKEIEMITKSLEKHNGKRKMAAQELGISERTLYRKIKEYNIGS
jgi:DNA-binding NtrC family response regulator